jgi:aminoglycoside phosphotransferase (APT) family kinase protein
LRKAAKIRLGDKVHPDEVDIDASVVRRLLAAQFPQWAGLPVKRFESAGTDNALFRLGEEMAVRLPQLKGPSEYVDLEHRWLPRLAPLLPVAIPAPLAKGSPAEGFPWPWSVYRWHDGENPAIDNLAEPGLLAQDLAAFITALRRIDTTDAPPAARGVPLASRDAPTRAAIDDLHGLVDTEAVTAVWEDTLRLPTQSGPHCWVHGDLSPGNVLTTRGRLSAVIDFGGVGVGDPTVDLMVAWNLLPAGAREVFRAALQVDDDTWTRGRGWALSIALIQLPYYRNTNPVLAANARHVIAEVLADNDRQATHDCHVVERATGIEPA